MMIPLGIADIYQAWSLFKFKDLLDWTSNVLEHAKIMVQQTSKFLLIFVIEERSLRYCLLLPVITPATPNHPRSNANLSQFAPRHSFMQTTQFSSTSCMSSRMVLPWLLGSSKLHRSRPWPVPPIQLVIRLTETQSKTCPDEELLLRTRHWSYKFVIFVLYVVDEGFLQFAMCLTQGRKQELNEIDMQCIAVPTSPFSAICTC